MSVEHIQRTVAKRVRECWGGMDIVDEDSIARRLRAHLRARSVPDEVVEAQLQRLAYFGVTASSAMVFEPSVQELAPAPPLGASGDLPALVNELAEAPLPVANVPTEEEVSEKEEEGLTGYIVSLTAKKSVRRLHYIGCCYRRPGKEYQDYEHYGATAPPPDRYHFWCKQCWGKQGMAEEEVIPEAVWKAAEEASVGDSSETSSADDEPDPDGEQK